MTSSYRRVAGLLAAAGLTCAPTAFAADSLQDVMQARKLSQQDVLAAVKTYVPTGQRDEFVAFSSGGQSGQVIVYGIPSMRILKYIGVFTPEPWQGYGFDESSKAILASGRIDGRPITWGDTHHPAISETGGQYDGQFLFINDKANPRLAVIDLRDFETKQIVVNPVFRSEHGGAFVTPNTDYIIEAAQYAAPLDKSKFQPLEAFNDKYRGGVTYWKFNRKEGRIVPEESFSIELPPYSQDLSDAGKGPSDGWSFTNSFCAERYVGGIEKGRPPYEAGCSAKDTDFLHVINWKRAAELVAAGKAGKINGHNVISIDTAVKEGILFLIPETKSPHGSDVTPDGKFIIVSGKLDTHATVYSFDKIQAAIRAKKFESKDPYGIPVIAMNDAMERQVQIGLGPLHTQFDSKPCVAYTSVYVDSQVARWDYCQGKVLDKLSVQYNIGHLMTMEGDSSSPKGKYLVALNKLAIDRFVPVGPLHPQNHQLVDIGDSDKMQLLYDMPLPLGEPHYAVAIEASKLKPGIRYKVGTDSRTDKPHPGAVRAGEEKVVRNGNKLEVYGTLIRSHITPETIEAQVGDEVTIYLTNLERAEDETHGFAISAMNVHASIEPGKTIAVKFKADREGVYPYYCTEFCSALHLEMMGYLLVKPKGWTPAAAKLAAQSYTETDYKATVKKIADTQAVIDSVVGYITSVNYKDYPDVVAMVEDATDQLGRMKDAKAKSETAAGKKDWEQANLWSEQVFQYQVKAADLGLRAKTYLEQHGAKKVAK